MPSLPLFRPAAPDDAAALRTLVAAVDASTPYLPREPGEWPVWCGGPDPAAALARFQARPNARLLVAEAGGALAGWLGATGGRLDATRGTVTLALGVAEPWRGHGIGTALLTAARRWAGAAGIRRLDLTVAAANTRAATLYRRVDFGHEGTLRRSARVMGELGDEHVMALLLVPGGPRCEPVILPPRPGPAQALAAGAAIRPAAPEDSAAYALFNRAVGAETPLLLSAAPKGFDQARRFLAGRHAMAPTLLAVSGDVVLGAVSLARGTLARERHAAGMALTVRRSAWGAGLGRRLLAAAEAWARDAGVVRLTARALSHDTRTRTFAAAAGFAEEAVCRSAAVLDGRVADLVILGRLL